MLLDSLLKNRKYQQLSAKEPALIAYIVRDLPSYEMHTPIKEASGCRWVAIGMASATGDLVKHVGLDSF